MANQSNYRYRTSSDVNDDMTLPIAPIFRGGSVHKNDNIPLAADGGVVPDVAITITTSDSGNHSPSQSHLTPLPCPSPYAGRHSNHNSNGHNNNNNNKDVIPASPIPLLSLPPSSPSPSSLGEPMILNASSTQTPVHHSYRDSIDQLIFAHPLPPTPQRMQEYDPNDDTTWIKFGCVLAIIIPLIGCLMWLITIRAPPQSNRKRWGNYSCGVALVIGVAVAIVWASNR